MGKKVLIVGAGPRGVAVAIEAKYRGHEPVLVDRGCMRFWKEAAPHMVMRSPLSFDLVYPGSPAWMDMSLIRYIHPGSNEPDWGDCPQRGIEYMQERCTREIFIEYFLKCREELDIPIVKGKALMVGRDWVHTTDGYMRGDVVVVATGLSGILNVPDWVIPVSHKLLTPMQVVDGLPIGAYAVVGSGQSAAEYCEFLASQGNKVYWLVNSIPRISQYPAPTYYDWGMKSALSDYYRTIQGAVLRQQYIDLIKAWQPSITPHIDNLIKKKGDAITPLEGPGTREGRASWEILQRKVDGILLCTGNKPSSIDYAELPARVSGALLLDRFMASNGVFHTGLSTVSYDGPRQASLISAGITAKEIMDAVDIQP
jgi:cation diffusion facilitator CzcD-associated flavoprotein CzcO